MSNPPGINNDDEETGTSDNHTNAAVTKTITSTMMNGSHGGTYTKEEEDIDKDDTTDVIIDEDEDVDIINGDKEPEDEEEKIFIEMEHEQEEKAVEEEGQQPKEIQAAPTLLRAALQKGEVKADESEEESDQEKQQQPPEAEKEEATVSPEQQQHHHHIHKRVSAVLERKGNERKGNESSWCPLTHTYRKINSTFYSTKQPNIRSSLHET
jgi:hypothetical protein